MNSLLDLVAPEQALFAIMCFAGVRPAELCAPRSIEIDPDRNFLTVPASKFTSRRIPVHPRLRAILAHPAASDALNNSVVGTQELRQRYKIAAEALNFPAGAQGLHSLRAFFAKTCLDAGVRSHIVCAWLGIPTGRVNRLSDSEELSLMSSVVF